MTWIAEYFDRFVVNRPRTVLLAVAAVVALLSLYATDFELDASADSLLLEDDQDLAYYRDIVARYGSDNYVVVTYTAFNDMFSRTTLGELKRLRDELAAMGRVADVISILDVPLINSPRTTLAALQKTVPTLEDPDIDLELARTELRESPVYSNLLMSRDGATTALLVRFLPNTELEELLALRGEKRERTESAPGLSTGNAQDAGLEPRIKALRSRVLEEEEADIAQIRSILDRYRGSAVIHLGGLPMIVSDMIEFIRYDIVVFGLGILAFLVALLSLIFARPRWVVISLLCCLVSVVMMIGLLGALQWRVTVVSSNFVALLLIFSLSLTVHLIQRYRELHVQHPRATQSWLLGTTLIDKARPCVYTAVTTMVGFGSLLISGIRPVIDFGWIMVIGMAVVLVTAFTVFPACAALLAPGDPVERGDSTQLVTGFFGTLVDRRPGALALLCLVLLVGSIWGISRLEVENRFIDYFKKDTEIYQGMLTIDRKLGGTVPLEVVLDPDQAFIDRQLVRSTDAAAGADDEFDAEFSDEFADEFTDEFADDFDEYAGSEAGEGAATTDLGATSFWYNTYRLGQLREVHQYLDSLPETGKVLSLSTTLEMLEILNQDETPGTFFLSVLYNRLPEPIKDALFRPYLSEDGNQVRISMRIFESDPDLRRGRLISEIRRHLVDEMGYQPDRVHITGMLVLYNNVLQSLYRSQILTLGAVFIAITLMFGLLFRSLRIALIAILPSILSVGIVLGSMGIIGIPLDIMTITIAAISVGIGVDDSIHYIHRYLQEIAVVDDPLVAMYRSHASVGQAMFYTSVIIIAGFSILALSNFIPTILFGLLTGLAMLMALIANLTLLPLLLKWGRVR